MNRRLTLNDLPPAEQATPVVSSGSSSRGGSSGGFDAREFITRHLSVAKIEQQPNGEKFVLAECPFNAEHKAPDAAVFVGNDGKLGFKCFHNSCVGKHWCDVRELFEPRASERTHKSPSSNSSTPRNAKPNAHGSTESRVAPKLVCMADVEPTEIDWLWYGRIPRGRITLLNGHPGGGKSFVTMDMSARVSTGTDWPDGSPCDRGSVLLLTAEDDAADTIRPRLDAHDADVSRIHCLTATTVTDDDGREREIVFTLADVDLLEAAIKSLPDVRLVVIDPIGSYLGAGTDSHRDNEVRGVLAPVAALAERYRVAVLIVCHTRKATSGRADDLVLGSRGFTGIARAVWHLSPDPDDANRRLLLAGKNNLVAPMTGLAFTISGTPARIYWEEAPVEMSADDALNIENKPDDGISSRATALGNAATWLRHALAAGPRPGKAVEADAVMAGIAPKTLERARSQLGVVCMPAGFGQPWQWSLPQSPSESANNPQSPPNSDDLANTGQNAGLFDENPRETPRVRQHSDSLAITGADGEHLADTDADKGRAE